MIISTKIKLRDKRLADALDDYAWRMDPELAELDATPPLTSAFNEYLTDYACELHHPSPHKRSLAIETLDGKYIGNCVYYNINKTKGEAEFGIMIGDRNYWDKSYGTDAVTTLLRHIFHQTKLNRIHLKTLTSNPRAYKCFEKCGFVPCGKLTENGYDFTIMEIHRQQWEREQLEGRKQSAYKVAGQ